MIYNARNEEITKIKNIQIETTNNIEKILNEYIDRVSDWANGIGCELICNSLNASTQYIYELYYSQIRKSINNDFLVNFSFEKVSKYFKVSDLCIENIKNMQMEIFNEMETLRVNPMSFKTKEDFIINDKIIHEFSNIIFDIKSKINTDYYGSANKVQDIIKANVLAQPMEFLIDIQYKNFLVYFEDLSNIYYCMLEWLKKNVSNIKQISEQVNQEIEKKGLIGNKSAYLDLFKKAIDSNSNLSSLPFTTNNGGILPTLATGAVAGAVSGAISNSAKKDGEHSSSTASNNEEKESLEKLKIEKQKMLYRQRMANSLKNIFLSLKDSADGIPVPLGLAFNLVGSFGAGACGAVAEWNDPNYQMKFDNLKDDDYKAAKKEIDDKNLIFDRLQKDKDFADALRINYDMTSGQRKNYYIDNSKEINEKIGKIIYNNQEYKYLLNMSDANLVKMGLADHYKTITGKNISNTPINFSPYINNENNTKPELKVKSNEIDILNKKFDENKEFNKLNFDKILSEITKIEGNKDDFKTGGNGGVYDGLVPIDKESEIGKLINSINGLTNSINTPNLLGKKMGDIIKNQLTD